MTRPSTGAQTERRGEAGPARVQLGGEYAPATDSKGKAHTDKNR